MSAEAFWRREAWFAALLLAFGVEFVWLGWDPHDRQTWLLENLLVVGAIPALVWLQRTRPLSRRACLWVFAFLALHEVGSHYTYSRVPWLDGLGVTERNHYDRLVHFAFGLCLVGPLRELLARALATPARLLDALTVAVLMALSSAYELIEFAAAQIVDPELGLAFVGAQGDVWDAQKDQSLALAGALIGLALDAIARRGSAQGSATRSPSRGTTAGQPSSRSS